MLVALLAASLFPSQAKMAMPGVSAVAISQGRVFAASDDGKGKIFERGKDGFHAVAEFAAGPHPMQIAVADLNGDGKPDLVIANHEQKYVTVLLGPDYAKPMQVAVEVTPHVHGVAVADLDGDGKPDLAINDMGGSRVVVLWGNGDGTFSKSATVQATGSKGHAYENVAVAGGRIFAPSWPQPQLAVLRVRDRALEAEALLELPNPAFGVVVMGGDVAVATYSGSIADKSRDGVFFLRGGHLPAQAIAAGPAPVRLAAGDVNGDGALDLAVCNLGGSVQVLLGDAAGLHEAEKLAVAHPQDVALGDLDGDGKADLAVAARDEVIVFLTR